jgi:hypothetical protein
MHAHNGVSILYAFDQARLIMPNNRLDPHSRKDLALD